MVYNLLYMHKPGNAAQKNNTASEEAKLEAIEETAEILAIPRAKEAIERGVLQAKKGEMRPLEDILTIWNESTVNLEPIDNI
jgi:hypothetical protein